jgi:hypothetical protein
MWLQADCSVLLQADCSVLLQADCFVLLQADCFVPETVAVPVCCCLSLLQSHF